METERQLPKRLPKLHRICHYREKNEKIKFVGERERAQMQDFSTAQLPLAKARDAWQCNLRALTGYAPCMGFPTRGFQASMKMREVGGISIAQFSHNILWIDRTLSPQPNNAPHNILLILLRRGKMWVQQAGSEVKIEPGDFMLLDSLLPFSSRHEGQISKIVAFLPAAAVSNHRSSSLLPRPNVLPGRTGIGAITRSTLLAIARAANQLQDGEADCARQMLTGAVRQMVDQSRYSQTDAERCLPERRIRAFIEARLADPELSPAQVADGCGISLRRLHRAFAATEWSVCSWIRHRRLEECHYALLDQDQDHVSITEIAFRWGFNDAAHFSRSFRSLYQCSPRDLRRREATLRLRTH